MRRSRSIRRFPIVACLAVLGVLAGTLSAPASAAPDDDASAGPQPDKLTAELVSAFDEQPLQDFWVSMTARADNSAARSIAGWTERGLAVYTGLRTTADRSQMDVRSTLDQAGVDYDPHWIVNAVRVQGGSLSLARDISALPSVASIHATVDYQLITPVEQEASTTLGDGVVEWGVANINADDVWAQFGVRGEGITVANVDTGVQYDHPALVTQYRGNLGGGSFDHDYNWFDAQGTGDVPTDLHGHGTHTMGTMAGDDGGANQVGVAPGANWIAASGCCPSDEALMDSMEWMLAPTDLQGENPDPGRRPHIINNSWGTTSPSDAPFGEEIQQAWNDAGIFGLFANGNSGPDCDTSGSPGSRSINFSSGAYDVNNVVAIFSARGMGQDTEIKPNISAPGVRVRSTLPGDTYGLYSGTSMAAPHVAGAVALLWSASPIMIGDVEGTRELLEQTAIDTEDLQCGGSADDNNVYGEGRLDALALLQAAPVGYAGKLAGTVTAADTGDPIAGALVEVTGPMERATRTDSNGEYDLALLVGTYDVTVSAFAYLGTTGPAEVTMDTTTTADFALERQPNFPVRGKVREKVGGAPIAGATVMIVDSPLSTETNERGRYRFAAVPTGSYDVTAEVGQCVKARTKPLTVDGQERLDFRLGLRSDAFGYTCVDEASSYVEGGTPVELTGSEAATTLELPFEFDFYGARYSKVYLSSNGHLNFLSPLPAYPNDRIPDPSPPNAVIAAFWDDLVLSPDSGVYSATGGEAPNRWFMIEYRNASVYGYAEQRLDFEVTLHERSGEILLAYRNLDPDPVGERERGFSATVGIEDPNGTSGLQYSYNQPVLDDATSIRFVLPHDGYALGAVTDANDGLPIIGAQVRAVRDGEVVRESITDPDGDYVLQLLFGAYQLEVTKPGYSSETVQIEIDDPDETVVTDVALETGVVSLEQESLELVLVPGLERTAEVSVTNDGTADLSWELLEVDRGSARVAPGVPANRDTARPDFTGGGVPSTATLFSEDQQALAFPQAPGDVIIEWPTEGVDFPFGIGVDGDGDVWVSDPMRVVNKEYRVDGTPTGVEHHAGWSQRFAADMAFDVNTGTMCQVPLEFDDVDIHCWDPATGDVSYVVPSSGRPWGVSSPYGLGYNAADDVFYLGGPWEGVVFTIAGRSHDTPGEVLNECRPEDQTISGLAYNSTSGTLWMATSSPLDTLYQINPTDCATISTLGDPGGAAFSGGGIELDQAGDIWATDGYAGVARLIDSGVPVEGEVPWLSEDPTSGALAPGATDTFTVTVDSTGLEPGTTYEATVIISTDTGRIPYVYFPVQLVVPAYQVGVNAGGDAYQDATGDTWHADQPFAASGWGWTGQRADVETTSNAIGGTAEDALYQDRVTGIFEYRFDDAPAGTYLVELDFAEFSRYYLPGRRIFDVRVNGSYELVAHDVAAEVGGLYADQHHIVVEHEGGQLTIEFLNWVRNDFPILNAVRITERSDM